MEEDMRAPQTYALPGNLNRPYEAYFPMSELQSDLSFIIQITAYITGMQSEVEDWGFTVRGHVIYYQEISAEIPPLTPPLFCNKVSNYQNLSIVTTSSNTIISHFLTNELHPSPSLSLPLLRNANDIRRLCLVQISQGDTNIPENILIPSCSTD